MNERPRPYAGISGVINTDQKYNLMEQFAHAGFDELPDRRKLALGVKAVHKTQYLDIQNKYGSEWYPVGETAFTNALDKGSSEVLQVAQVYFDAEFVHDEEYRAKFVDRIRRRGKAWLSAIQFDLLPWHDDDAMLDFVEQVKQESDLIILLQAHGEAMERLGPNGVARKLGRYAHALDYILFDASHGKGVRMDMESLKPFLYAGYASAELSNVGFGVAGGLNADIVRQDLPELFEEYAETSVDSEGQLHPLRPDGTRPLDPGRSTEYLNALAEVLYEGYN